MEVIFFNKDNPNWTNDPEKNMEFLKRIERICNEKFKHNRYLFLNDVLLALGYETTTRGDSIGWLWEDEDTPFSKHHIDFGIYKPTAQARRFVNGISPDIELYLNDDGNIGQCFVDMALARLSPVEDEREIFDKPWLYYDKIK